MYKRQVLLRLLQLCSPALPVGAYAYSQGLESAVDRGWVSVSYTHLRAHETVLDLVCRLLLEKKKKQITHPEYR